MPNPNYEYSDQGIPKHCGKEMAKNGNRNGKQRWRCLICGHPFTEGALAPGRPTDGPEVKTEAERSSSYYQRQIAKGLKRRGGKWVKIE
jgi:transposase-like protein